MIKLQNYTPEIYYKESRDFQLLGRLYDLVLNAIKTEVDLLYNLPLSNNSDDKVLELLALTLGFKPKHQYNAKHLKAVCSVLPELMRYKGSIKALKIACEALFNAMDINQKLDYDFNSENDNTELNLYIAQEFGDITILTDLLNYILPAGMSCNIIREFHLLTDSQTNIGLQDTVETYTINTLETSQLADLSGVINLTETKIGNKAGFITNSEIIKL